MGEHRQRCRLVWQLVKCDKAESSDLILVLGGNILPETDDEIVAGIADDIKKDHVGVPVAIQRRGEHRAGGVAGTEDSHIVGSKIAIRHGINSKPQAELPVCPEGKLNRHPDTAGVRACGRVVRPTIY